ncbi:MAG: hypothetical protein K2G19_06910 [Lachnospiraceae bacterium]|nr:hypothetical protein [Lachnospiraceae bacterium]
MKRTNVNKIAGVSLKIFGASVWAGISLFPLLFSLLSSFKNNTSIYGAPFSLPEN